MPERRGFDLIPTPPIVDLHADSLTRPSPTARLSGRLTPERMQKGGYLAQVFAIFFPPKEQMTEGDSEFLEYCLERYRKLLRIECDRLAPARSAVELDRNRREGRISTLLSIEDARILSDGETLCDRIALLQTAGVRMVGLCWNRANGLAFPASDDRGQMSADLTEAGRRATEALVGAGMLVDVSHLSDGGFRTVAKLARGHFLASHSGCRALCEHPRNLSDDMLRTLGSEGGIAGVNFYPPFVGKGKQPTLDRVVDHLLHMVDVGGEELPALGSDFDGFECPSRPGSPDELPRLVEAMLCRRLPERLIDRITHENALRLIRRVIG